MGFTCGGFDRTVGCAGNVMVGCAHLFWTHLVELRRVGLSGVDRGVHGEKVEDDWKPTIDAWLTADREMSRKQRHTARRVWLRLVTDHDAKGGDTTVRRYVADATHRLPSVLVEVKVPQSHPLGAEAEVDFGHVSFFLDGLLPEGWMVVFRLSASGKAFHRVYLNQAQQAFFDGHDRAFACSLTSVACPDLSVTAT